MLALTFGYVPYRLYGHSGFSRYLELRRDLSKIRRDNVRLQLDNGRLGREAAALRTDARLLEREARTRLQWVKPGEVLFDLGGTLRGSHAPRDLAPAGGAPLRQRDLASPNAREKTADNRAEKTGAKR